MKKILVTVPFTENQKNELNKLALDFGFECIFDEEFNESVLYEVSGLIGNVPVSLLKDKTKIEWIQLNSSGADAYAMKGAVPENTMITCATGAYGLGISEYMVGMLLLMMKKIPLYLENQKKGIWSVMGNVATPYGKRVLLVGTGNIGLEFAKRMKVFGCTLVGIRNRSSIKPVELDEVYGIGELKNQVGKADVIALSLPGTKSSFHMFNKEILMACKKDSYLLNVGRGTAIDTAVLKEPEVYQHFAGIWLDVAEIEPLPEKDPLFFIPGLYLTPHITGGYHLAETTEKIFEISKQNFIEWAKGGNNYIHIVNRDEGYSLQ